MKTKPLKTKLMAFLLALCMVLSLVPISAFAAELDFLPQGVKVYKSYKNTYHTKLNVTANVSVEDSDGAVVETTQVSKSSEDFIKGNLSDEAVQIVLTDLFAEIETPYKAKGTVTIGDGNGQMAFDHFESATLYTFTPTSGNAVDFKSDLEAVKQYFNEHPDAAGTFTEFLDVHEYQKYGYTYDLTVQEASQSTSTITKAAIEDVKFDYQPGDAPQATAQVAVADADKYEIAYECWQQFENSNPVAAWYSDNSSHGSLPTIAKFESGKSYVYSIMLNPKDGYSFSSETVVTVNGEKVSAPFVGGSMYVPAIKTITPSKQSSTITVAAVENVKFDYKHGENPQATATVAADQDKYDITYESWEKMENTDESTIEAVAYWYSEDSWYNDEQVRLTAFDKDGMYQYYVRLKAKDGCTFSDSLSVENITLNGKSLPEGSGVIVLDEGKSCLIIYGMTVHTIRSVEEIRFNGPTIDAISGDEPRFTGNSNSAYYDVEYQKWEDKDNRRIGVNSDESKNGSYDQVITSFEYGKTYIYGVSFNIADLGLELGYRFDENTKFYINDEEITLNSDQVQVYDGGMSIQFKDVLSMTPEAPWQKIDVVEIEGATITFKDGDKPVFTGKTPENAPYIYQFECWETKDGAGVNSAEFFDNAYEKHITAFHSGETYQYILYMKAEHGYYFTDDTKIKINGTLYSYRLVNIDPDYDSSGKMYTFWAYTDLTMMPKASDTTPEYKIIEGANNTWTQNSDGTLTFRANGDFSKFTGVKVDGTLITADKYTASSGSTVITLKKDYLDTLSVGNHILTVIYIDGECSTEFEIKVANTTPGTNDSGSNPGGTTPSEDKPNTDTMAIPQTGDTSNMFLWFTLLFISGGATIGTTVINRKKKYNR